MAFIARTEAPTTNDKWYVCTDAIQRAKYGSVRTSGGLNECIIGNGSANGMAMPNCVGYAWGRWYEILGTRPNLSRGDANQWYSYNDGYVHRKDNPELGAVCCFSTQHVCIIETKISNTEYITSGSYWGTTGSSSFFVKERLKYINGTWKRCNFTTGNPFGEQYQGFQGFIILPTSDPDNVLDDLFINGVEIGFNPYVFEYTQTTYRSSTAILATPRYTDQSVMRYINGEVVREGESRDLREGENILFVFTTRNGNTTQYKVILYYGTSPPSTRDSKISNIQIVGTDFDDNFSEFGYDYTYELIGNRNRITAYAKNQTSVVIVYHNGSVVGAGEGYAEASIEWNVGLNEVRVQSVLIEYVLEIPTTVYTSDYYINVYSATDTRLVLLDFYEDSAKDIPAGLTPEFQQGVVNFKINTKLRQLYWSAELADPRCTIQLDVNKATIVPPSQQLPIKLKAGLNTIDIYAVGYSYDGTTIVMNRYQILVYVAKAGGDFKIIYATRLL